VGQLRLPFTGPGAMTDTEYGRLLDTIGDPNKIVDSFGIERLKLQTVLNKLNSDMGMAARNAGFKMPTGVANSFKPR